MKKRILYAAAPASVLCFYTSCASNKLQGYHLVWNDEFNMGLDTNDVWTGSVRVTESEL